MARHLFDISSRRHFFRILMIIRNPPADNDAFQIQSSRQVFSRLIQPVSDFHPPVFRVNHYLNPVQIQSVRVVVRDITVVCNVLPRVAVIIFIEIDDQA